jgi:hypothetical protein
VNLVDPVFVDRSGRRRRLFTALGAGLGVLLMAGCALLIAGVLGASPVPLPGLPQHGRYQDGLGSAPSAPASGSSSPARPSRGGQPTTSAGASPGPSASEPRDNRKTAQPGNVSHPANPKPSRTK